MINEWVGTMCQMLPKVIRASLIGVSTGESLASWPDDHIDLHDLTTAASLCGNRKAPVVSAGEASSTQQAAMIVAFPMIIPQQTDAVFSVELVANSSQQGTVLQLLQWGQRWLDLLAAGENSVVSANTASTVISLLDKILKRESVTELTTALATLLADHCGMDRISVGFINHGTSSIAATSHHHDFQRRGLAFQLASDCLLEASESGTDVTFTGNDAIGGAHERYASTHSVAWLKSYLWRVDGRVIGGIVCERKSAPPLAADTDAIIHSLLSIVGPYVESRRLVERTSWQKLTDQMSNFVASLRSGEPTVLAVTLAGCCVLLASLWLLNGDYQVTANAELEGRIQRAVVAPEDGYIRDSFARAGDLVKEGDVLAELDDRELKLEYRRWLSKKSEHQQQYNKELMAMDHSQMQIVKAQISQADAQIEMLEQRLSRIRLLAPISGVLIKGDLSRSLGAPVERGELLFEVAPVNEYRLVLSIKEQDIRHLAVGQQGELHLTAMPNQTIPFQVESVATVFDQLDGAIVYRTEASIALDLEQLRPGMSGYGKVAVGQKSYLWILSHDVLEWVTEKLWVWGW